MQGRQLGYLSGSVSSVGNQSVKNGRGKQRTRLGRPLQSCIPLYREPLHQNLHPRRRSEHRGHGKSVYDELGDGDHGVCRWRFLVIELLNDCGKDNAGTG